MTLNWDGVSCPYCDVRMDSTVAGREPTWDHIVPRDRGGSDESANCVVACARCNLDKNAFLLEEWHSVLIRECDHRSKFVGRVLHLMRHKEQVTRASNGTQHIDGRIGDGASDPG